MIMFEIETKDLKINEELNRKIDMICRFACVKYEFIPGNIKSIKNTNIAYVKPHILKVNGKEECEEVFINGYNEKILNKLEEYSNYDFDIKSIFEKYDNDKRIKQNLISLNKKNMQIEMKEMINENLKNNDCLKYTHFLFDRSYTKYTGIDKKFFDKLKNS